MSGRNRTGRIVGGRGTHNRPWIIDEDSADQNPHQHQQQPFRMSSRTHSSHNASNNDNNNNNSHRRSSASDISSVASESSYERYLAQRRAEAASAAGGRSHPSSSMSSSSGIAIVRSNSTGSNHHRQPQPQPQPQPASSGQGSFSDYPSESPQYHNSTTSGKASGYQQYQDHQMAAAASAPSPEKKSERKLPQSSNDTNRNSSLPQVHDDTPLDTRRLTPSTAVIVNQIAQQLLDPGTVSSRRSKHKGGITREEPYSISSRDLRARRLAQQRQSSSGSSGLGGGDVVAEGTSLRGENDVLDTSISTSSLITPSHFQAHDAAVEKYLMRSRVATGRSRTLRSSASSSERTPSVGITTGASTHATKTTLSTRDRTEDFGPRSVGSTTTNLRQSVRSQTEGVSRSSSTPSAQASVAIGRDLISAVTLKPDSVEISCRAASESPLVTHHDAAAKVEETSAMGWSTVKRSSTTGRTSMTVEAIAAHEKYKAETAAAAAAAVIAPVSSGSSKVDQYLAQRIALKQRSSSFTRLTAKKNTGTTESMEYHAMVNLLSVPIEASSADESPESSSESDNEELIKDDECSVDDDPDMKEWSLKVCIISAVDFPASLVPNLPLSPFLKVGLVRLKVAEENPQCVDSAISQVVVDQGATELTAIIGRDGLTSIPGSRVRCTSSKIISKRDNGCVEFHEEMRWDGVKHPHKMALVLELSSRAVLTPANFRESPPAQTIGPFQLPTSPYHSIGRAQAPRGPPSHVGISDGGASGLSSLFRKIRKNDSAEMEEANAAAAVAKLLVQGDASKTDDHQENSSAFNPSCLKSALGDHQSEFDVTLRRRKRRKKAKMTEELSLGAKVIPLTRLPLDKATNKNETARIEQWFELDTSINTVKTSKVGSSPSLSITSRNPSVLVEISLSSNDVLEDSEDEWEGEEGKVVLKASYAKRASLKIRDQLKQEVKPSDDKVDEPMLEPGVIDYICVVGARDIGDQKADDGARGWVNSTPECCVLEQVPSNDEFHLKNGRTAVLPGKVEWFCFPEGCRLWRGSTPPNHDELNMKRFSASSPAHVSTAIASFDACLGCTTSFSWFVISSNADQYGSESKKTYGAVIRFYVPAPTGIDPTQDDFAQAIIGTSTSELVQTSERKRLWVPIGICMTSGMPIIGVMEVMLLRLCESLSSTGVLSAAPQQEAKSIHEALVNIIISFQKPIPGVVSCSFPFLEGDRLHIALPPRIGLPPLPHGSAVASVCRLLGADGLNYLLAAFLTECKILLHSDEVANLCLVAEVMTSLLYPFQWALPYVPVLPAEMMEFIEAPVSFLLGVPSCNVQLLDPSILEDIVVVDLDRDFSSSDYFEVRRNGHKTRSPVPLPAAVASNISKAVFRLIRAEEEVKSFGASNLTGPRSFPRMEPENLPEREFRISVALEVCGLIRGFDECLVFSSSQPVFNVDKFLKIAPAIFEEQRGTAPSFQGENLGPLNTRYVISPRSRRFVSILVCCQHFHQLLEMLEADSLAFFHVIMRSLQARNTKRDSSLAGMLRSLDSGQTVLDLCKTLQGVEDKTPTYRVKSLSSQWPTIFENGESRDLVSAHSTFPFDLLQQIVVECDVEQKGPGSEGVKSVSLEYLVELEKNPWRYQKLFNLDASYPGGESPFPAIERVKIREAIGDRRYRAWKSGYDKFDGDEGSVISEESRGLPSFFDLRSLLASVTGDTTSATVSSDNSKSRDSRSGVQKNVEDRDIVRRCLENAKLSNRAEASQTDASRGLVSLAEDALQNPSAQKFLLAILSKRAGNDAVKTVDSTQGRRRSLHAGGAKLDSGVFEVFIRLSFAMLNSCAEIKDFESAYSLLNLTAGLYAPVTESNNEVNIVYLTERIGLHPIYADLGLWEKVKCLHATAHQHTNVAHDGGKTSERNDEYEAVVATLYEMNGYGIPAEELARFASRMCLYNGWFHSEKGQSLLMLAKRVCIRRDHGPVSATPSKMSDLDLISLSRSQQNDGAMHKKGLSVVSATFDEQASWVEVGWCHPAAQSSRRAGISDTSRRTNQNMPPRVEEKVALAGKEQGNYMKRSAVTSMAYLGSSVVVSGGLDGGVFMARKVVSPRDSDKYEGGEPYGIRGVHLDWGSSGSRYTVGSASTSLDGEYGVGAVVCLAATRSALGATPAKSTTKDVVDLLEDEDIIRAMDGCRVVAGTSCGDLRVWSVKDVFSAVFYANRGGDMNFFTNDAKNFQRVAGSSSSTYVSSKTRGGTDFAAGSSLTRLKFSLRGRALSGHRGGVSCIDVHSNVYRPDSIVSGGADGLIKLWSLRTPGTSGSRKPSLDPASSTIHSSQSHEASPRCKAANSGDALSILSGHGGRIMCLKTAWHGDRLLSGGADRTVRLWDLAGSGGKCLTALSGHFGWVTNVQYWGPNTIISASTDRSIALWDVRVCDSPLFMLRHHHAPVSDLLIGNRSDPVMISSAIDGSVAAWDFRHLTGASNYTRPLSDGSARQCKVVRNPTSKLYTHKLNGREHALGPLHLSKGVSTLRKTAFCIGSDAIIREWDYKTGDIVNEHVSGHCDAISSFVALSGDTVLDSQLECTGPYTATSTISASWDGTVRMRTLAARK